MDTALTVWKADILRLREEMRRQEAEDIKNQVEQSIRKNSARPSGLHLQKAVKQYELVKEGDKVAVCISGGKDSMLMAKLFQELKLHNKFPFEVEFLVMDPDTARITVM